VKRGWQQYALFPTRSAPQNSISARVHRFYDRIVSAPLKAETQAGGGSAILPGETGTWSMMLSIYV
jgi:hypothetical protein